MTRTVPAPLQAHLDGAATTTTRLLKISLKNGFVYGLCMLDRDIEYDDGAGPINYIASNGFDSSELAADVGYSVANAEGLALLSNDVPGIDTAQIRAGDLDDATWICYLVNFEDLSMGHILLDAGDLGEVRERDGIVWFPELLSYITRLRQPIGSVWSRTCRAVFGSPADSQTGCGIDLAPLWANGEVTAVGAESNRVFTGDTLSAIAPFPGRVQFLTGANAGREFATEGVAGLVITLSDTTPYPIAEGDTYRIRPDCRKRYQEDCIDVYDNGPNFKGEPHIPVGDSSAVQAPGGQLPGGGSFIGRIVDDIIDGDSP